MAKYLWDFAEIVKVAAKYFNKALSMRQFFDDDTKKVCLAITDGK